MSLRVKFILALLFSSLASVALVGGVAYHQLNHKFDDAVREQSFRHFQADVLAYVQRYGSWDQASASQPFADFVRLRHEPGPDAMQGGMPPPGPGTAATPPFRFLLMDPDYRVLLPIPPYHAGERASPADQAMALSIRQDGRLLAWATAEGLATLSAQDQAYLTAMREALAAGLLAATLLALVLGITLGTVLSRALRQLTGAATAMKDGTLRQKVELHSQDEVGVLAAAFNRMSEDITRNHEELLQTNATIRQQAEMLRELSIRDPLTGLYNRRHFDEYAARLFAEARRYHHPLTAVLGDVDHFKQINDHYSHAIGDAVLKELAELLRVHSRTSDMVARYGGEEFVVMLAETGLPQSAHVCELLRRAVENHDWERIAPGLKVTISLGICDIGGRDDMESVLAGADKALYEAKDAGRNCIRAAAPLKAMAEDTGPEDLQPR